MNICLILRPPRGRPGIGLPTPGRSPHEWSRIEIQLSGSDFGAVALHLDPAGRHADLVVAQHVVRHPVSVGAAIGPRIFQRRIEAAAQLDVECDRSMFGRVKAHLDGAQRFDNAIVNRPDIGARRVG